MTIGFLSSRAGRALVLSTAAILFIGATFFISPNSARMQTGANTIAFDRDGENGTRKVFVMNADGSNLTELANGYDPVYSPDGSKIAYVTGDRETSDIWVMNADGSNQTQVTQNFASFSPAFSPDGSRIAFVSSHEAGFNIYVIDTDGTDQRRLELGAAGANIYERFNPAFSPDGTKIYFSGGVQGEHGTEENLYAVNADGSGGLVQLTFATGTTNTDTLAVAPDGQKIVVRFQHDLRAVATNGTGAMTNLTNGNPEVDRHPAYAPDGARIVFERNDYLFVMNADGTNPTSLDVVGDNPSWNPTAVLPPPPTPTPSLTPTPSPTVTPTPATEADLSVSVSSSAKEVAVGGMLTYTITVTNNSSVAAATNVKLKETLSATMGYAEVEASQGACLVGSNPMTCELGSLAPRAEATVTVKATHNQAGTATNAASVEASEFDPNTANNSESINITVLDTCARPIAIPIEITRSQWRRDDRSGQDELIMTIRNRSNESVNPRLIFVFDNLPEGVSVDPSVVDGYTQCAAPIGSPYLVATAPNKKDWKPMQTVSVRVLFNNPSRVSIPIDWRLYNSTENP